VAVQSVLSTLRSHVTRVLDLVPPVRRTMGELSRIELLDRSLALGAQALLALIPMLMVLGAFMPRAWAEGVVQQVRDVIGLRDDVMAPVRQLALDQQTHQTQTGIVGAVVSLASASSFSRALQRMYARAWDLPGNRGVRALRSSLVWILGWLVMLQVTAMLLRSLSGVAHPGPLQLLVQLTANTLLWWWTSRLLLGGRVPWRRLLPGAAVTALLLVVLNRSSTLVMPAFTRSNLEQFGPLGVVFAIGSWLVVFGGVLVVATVLGRQLSLWWIPASAADPVQARAGDEQPSGRPSHLVDRRRGASRRVSGVGSLGARLPGRDPAGEEERAQRQQGEHEQRRPQAG
jgi:membrane protein